MILYIHIPFCASKCGYCAFNSAVIPDPALHEAYIQSLLLDIHATLGAYRAGELEKFLDFSVDSGLDPAPESKSTPESPAQTSSTRESKPPESKPAGLASIYIGGGTPSLLASSAYAQILTAVDEHCPIKEIAEITIEANPNHLSAQWCRDLFSFGVNRISMGVQSFCQDKLSFLERDHSPRDIAKALESAQIFPHTSIDLIYGTPHDAPDSYKILRHDLHTACALPIGHLSAYALTIEQGARFWHKHNQHKHSQHKHGANANDLHELGDNAAQAAIVREIAGEYGFAQYEVSNFARGAKSLHNRAYWAGEEYLGCGLSAVGRVGQCRYHGQESLAAYIASPLRKHLEPLTRQDLDFETLFLGLRSDVGVDMATLRESKRRAKRGAKGESSSLQELEWRLEILLSEGKCELRDGRLFAGDVFLADEIALWLW